MNKINQEEMINVVSSFESEWLTCQPEELREIGCLITELSKALLSYQDDRVFCKKYSHEVCNEIKQLAYDFQRKMDYGK